MKTKDKIKLAYFRAFGVIAIDYDPSKPLPRAKNKIAVEICEDGTVFEHARGGTTYIKFTDQEINAQ